MSENQTIVNILDTIHLILIKVFGASWRTTVMGILEGIGTAVIPFVGLPNFQWKTHAPFIAVGVVKAIFGAYTKDKSVTGGVNENTVTKNNDSTVTLPSK